MGGGGLLTKWSEGTESILKEKPMQRHERKCINAFFFLAKTVVRIPLFNFFGQMLTPILRDQI